MTELHKMDNRIDRCIRRRDGLKDRVTDIMRQIRNRDKYIAHLGKLRSEMANYDLEGLTTSTDKQMKSTEKLSRYKAALAKYQKDLTTSKALNTPPPIHLPTRVEFEITRPEENFHRRKN